MTPGIGIGLGVWNANTPPKLVLPEEVSGFRFRYDCDPDNPRSVALPQENIFRFEILPGDQGAASDPAGVRHRSEMICLDMFDFDVTFWVAYSWRLLDDSGPKVPGNFTIAGQWHGRDPVFGRRPPIVAMLNSAAKLRIQTASSDELTQGGDGIVIDRYTAPTAVPVGVWQPRVQEIKFGQHGVLHWWENGVNILDIDDGPIGYYGDAIPQCYPHQGIYTGDVNHPDVVAAGGSAAMAASRTIIEYANIEIGTADLTARILNPLPI